MSDENEPGTEVVQADQRQVQESPNGQRRREAREAMLADVQSRRGDISTLLRPFGVDFEFFETGFRIFLMRQIQTDPDFFLKVSAVSLMESLFRIAANGLIADGKQAAIAVYKGVATPMFMRDGLVAILWRTGLIKSINDQVVTKAEDQAGRFEYEEGDHGFIRHKPLMSRKETDPIVAAYCVIEMTNGGFLREVVPEGELAKIRSMSRSDARKAWPHQMDRKAAIRRIMGKMPREKAIAQILSDDDAFYDLRAAVPTEPEPSGVRGRLDAANAGQTVARPGFAAGHAESQTGPRAPDELDQRLAEASEAAPAEGADVPPDTQTPAQTPSGGPGDDFPGDRPAPMSEPLAWADAQRRRLGALTTLDALNEMVDHPDFARSLAALHEADRVTGKSLEAAITGRRKALTDKERR